MKLTLTSVILEKKFVSFTFHYNFGPTIIVMGLANTKIAVLCIIHSLNNIAILPFNCRFSSCNLILQCKAAV